MDINKFIFLNNNNLMPLVLWGLLIGGTVQIPSINIRSTYQSSESPFLKCDLRDFNFRKHMGEWCTIDSTNNSIGIGYSRPSSGRSSTNIDLNSGLIRYSWDFPGIGGHGEQVVNSSNDGRYPEKLDMLIGKLFSFKKDRLFSYLPDYKGDLLSEEDKNKLDAAIACLSQYRYSYPTVELLGMEINELSNQKFLRILVRGIKTDSVKVYFNYLNETIKDSDSTFRKSTEFDGLLPFPTWIYNERKAQKALESLEEQSINSISEQIYAGTISLPINNTTKAIQFVVQARNEKGLVTNLGNSDHEPFRIKL